MAARGPDVVFGWATELTSAQVLQVGRVVMELLAQGAPADLGRGLGLAWEGSARIPRHERDTLFRAFAELEAVVAGVLAGRDLVSHEVAPQPHGIGSLAQLFGARPQGQTAVAAAIDAAGEPGRRGLVALWNTWMAMRYRSSISVATFELLTRPWVSVVGRLPER